jgi:hypothetical protein
MVEILQQPETECLRQVGVRLGLGHAGGHLDGDLLEANRRLQRGLIGGLALVRQRLLVLLDAADPGQGRLEGRVHPGTGMREAEGLRLDAVHEDDAHPGERVVGELAAGRLNEIFPGEDLLFDRDALLLQQ